MDPTARSISDAVYTSPSSNISSYYFGVFLALLSSITAAIRMTSRQQLIKTNLPESVVNFQFSAFGTTAWFFFYSCKHKSLFEFDLESVLVGLITGLSSVVVAVLYARALKYESIQVLGVVGGLDIVYAVLLQKIVLNETCETTFIIGASLIVFASLLVCSLKLIAKRRDSLQTKLMTC